MTKKSYILQVLEKLQGHRSKAEEVTSYLLAYDDPEYIDYIYQELVAAVHATLQEEGQDTLKNLVGYLDVLEHKESLSKQADENDIKDLEQIMITM